MDGLKNRVIFPNRSISTCFFFALQKTSRKNAACCVQMRSVDQTIHEGYTNRSQARMEALTAFCVFVLIKIGVKYQKKPKNAKYGLDMLISQS